VAKTSGTYNNKKPSAEGQTLSLYAFGSSKVRKPLHSRGGFFKRISEQNHTRFIGLLVFESEVRSRASRRLKRTSDTDTRPCPRRYGARQPYHLVSLFSPGHEREQPSGLPAGCHLKLVFNDITKAAPGQIASDPTMVSALVDFGCTWDETRPLLIHCWAGISRSTAAAFIVACEKNPGCERDIAWVLRARAPFATPNRLMGRWPTGCCHAAGG
jgi:predicted protein tyrosine phosphatase